MVAPPAVHPSVRSLKQQGDKSYEARDFSAAIEHYSEALEVVDDAVLLSNRSAAHAQRRRLDRALADADRALKLQPEWPRLYHRRGYALFHIGRYGEAIAAFEHGSKLDPADTPLQEALRKAYAYTERVADEEGAGDAAPPVVTPKPRRSAGAFSAQAAATARPQAAAARPQEDRVHKDLPAEEQGAVSTAGPSVAPGASSASGGQAAAAQPQSPPAPAPRPTGQRASFTVVHEKVVERKQPSVTAKPVTIHVKGSVVEGTPCTLDGTPWLQLDTGWMLIDGKSVGLGQLLRPEEQPVKPRADELREQGNTLFREKRYSKAIWAYTESIEENPHDARTWSNRAAAQMGELQVLFKTMGPGPAVESNSYFKEALSDLDQALSIDPKYVKAWARKGQLFSMSGDRERAVEAFDRGLRLDPASAECHAGRAAAVNL